MHSILVVQSLMHSGDVTRRCGHEIDAPTRTMSENSRSVAETPASGESVSARERGPEGDASSKMKTFLKQQLGKYVYHYVFNTHQA